MAPSQRGLGVMMKRGRKGLTGRLNTACGVHINIENVISCEPRQLASEVRMRKTNGLVEAPPGSPWLEELQKADCKQLMNLLQESPCLVVQKSKGGFTVVHAAAMRGCLKLLDQVFDLFKDKCRFVDEEEGIELSLQDLLKAESICRSKGNFGRTYDDSVNEEGIGEARLTAAEYAWWSMGDYECRDYLLHGGGYSKPFLSNQSGTFGSSIGSEVDDEESPPPRPVLLGVLACHRRLLSDRMRSRFQEDLDYNFVADCEELRFHHACENLIFDGDCRRYVEAVIRGCVEKGPHVLRHLFQLRNAQGQTPLHLALESHSNHYLVRLIPGGNQGKRMQSV